MLLVDRRSNTVKQAKRPGHHAQQPAVALAERSVAIDSGQP
ncbi:MAG: hypothetical protein AAF282_08145 [Cyanobacteria bacterium P01_A01_bin.15]